MRLTAKMATTQMWASWRRHWRRHQYLFLTDHTAGDTGDNVGGDPGGNTRDGTSIAFIVAKSDVVSWNCRVPPRCLWKYDEIRSFLQLCHLGATKTLRASEWFIDNRAMPTGTAIVGRHTTWSFCDCGTVWRKLIGDFNLVKFIFYCDQIIEKKLFRRKRG